MSYIPNLNDVFSILPMLVLSGTGILLLFLQFLIPDKEETIPLWTLCLLGLIGSLFSLWYVTTSPGYGKYFLSQVSISPLSVWLNAIYIISGIATLFVAPRALKAHKSLFPEFFALLLFAITGMMFLTSGYDLIVIFVGLEIFSLSLYIMIGMTRDSIYSLESAMKYFLLGVFSSGFMLLGIAFLYGGSGTTNLDGVLRGLFLEGYESNYSKLGFGLLLIGIFFKAALVPFHSWTPDVYEGSQTPITGFMASAGKAAAMGLLLVLFQHIPAGQAGEVWKYLVGGISLLSMTWGNLIALRQENLKRLLAYSSISHAGYICAGIACGANLEALYYLVIYAVMNLGAFAIITHLENGKAILTLDSISHLSAKFPLTAVALSVLFLSFAGFPPLAGFWAKLFLLQKIAESDSLFHRVILFGAVANSALGFYYYMKITIQSYMKSELGEIALGEEINPNFGIVIVVSLSLVLMIAGWLVFQPGAFL
ncbi:NADH-quinone oxidoreductase subunit N [Leptospira ognonensis]|uniref:NADH-quinone oxidoreductase subunit N n=1 Tax=Leptospira ognonensis TaxID=2484945 RepID=A0A4R9JZT4_9LEPT|nr:NADH-quinone oxidoreductase subunit N [Leptospira ognonensis]TGL58219.1 NADH-quinone oxidoreductase subunit N [Leptospira ognonensis]